MDSTGISSMSRFTRSPLTWALAAFLGMLGFQAGTYVGSLPPTSTTTSTGEAVFQPQVLGPCAQPTTLVSQAEQAGPVHAPAQPSEAQ